MFRVADCAMALVAKPAIARNKKMDFMLGFRSASDIGNTRNRRLLNTAVYANYRDEYRSGLTDIKDADLSANRCGC
jgi:hypothetical protein